MRDRLIEIGERIDEGVGECWRVARRGDALVDAIGNLDPMAARRDLEAAKKAAKASPGDAQEETVKALEAQVASADRLTDVARDAQDKLRLLDARLDEAVARAVELSITADDVGRARRGRWRRRGRGERDGDPAAVARGSGRHRPRRRRRRLSHVSRAVTSLARHQVSLDEAAAQGRIPLVATLANRLERIIGTDLPVGILCYDGSRLGPPIHPRPSSSGRRTHCAASWRHPASWASRVPTSPATSTSTATCSRHSGCAITSPT